MDKKGLLVVISAPSGCGKDTVIDEILARDDSFCYSVSATTRGMRDGEIDGKNYFFVSKSEFEKLIEDKKIIEYTVYCENYYGTPREYVDKMVSEGKNVILKIETEGMINVKKAYPEALTFFIAPPDMETLRMRLEKRGTETKKSIEKRLKRAIEEMKVQPYYDYTVINYEGAASKAADEIIEIVNRVRAAG